MTPFLLFSSPPVKPLMLSGQNIPETKKILTIMLSMGFYWCGSSFIFLLCYFHLAWIEEFSFSPGKSTGRRYWNLIYNHLITRNMKLILVIFLWTKKATICLGNIDYFYPLHNLETFVVTGNQANSGGYE